MNPGTYQIRRATVEDLDSLRDLWRRACLPVDDLEKRFTEFQLAVNEAGELLGGLGLLIFGAQGKLHSEAFTHPELEEQLRPLIWERMQILAHNHGLAQFWTMEESPFWQRYAGFKPAGAPDLERLPVHFGDRQARWLTLPLRDSAPQADSIEQHLKWFREAQQADIERMMRRASLLKKIATGIALLLFVLVLLGGFLLLRRRPGLFGR
jgi:N-acetylglutamate synthase-like GNAT family acetyltransferase